MRHPQLAASALSITLALTMMSTTAFAASVEYTDVPADHWARPAITSMADKGIMTGVGNNLFAPDKTITYAEFITMLVRQFYADKLEEPAAGDAWYDPFVAVADTVHILGGTDVYEKPSSWQATDVIDRYDMAQIMYNLILQQGIWVCHGDTSKIGDWSFISSWEQSAVSGCYGMGLLSGVDSNGTFNGTGSMDRAQAAVVMSRLIDICAVSHATSEHVKIPAKATHITSRSQLKVDEGLSECDGGFRLDPWRIMYGCAHTTFTSTGYDTVTFTFTAADKDVRIEYRVKYPTDRYVDPMHYISDIVVKAGETQTLTFDCSGTKTVGFTFTDATIVESGIFVEGIITDLYLW